jgi:hypothetical protein
MHGSMNIKFGILVSIEEYIDTAFNKLRYCTYMRTKNRITPRLPLVFSVEKLTAVGSRLYYSCKPQRHSLRQTGLAKRLA